MSLIENMREFCEDKHTDPQGQVGCLSCDFHFGRITQEQYDEAFEDW